MEVPRKARTKETVHSHQLLVMPLPVQSFKTLGTRNQNREALNRQPLQECDQQVRGPRWNTGIPPGAVDRRPQGSENRSYPTHVSEAPPARSWNDVPTLPRDEGRRGNQYPRSSSADSQFRQPLQECDQQVRGPRWNTGIPPGAVDRRPQGSENRSYPTHVTCEHQPVL